MLDFIQTENYDGIGGDMDMASHYHVYQLPRVVWDFCSCNVLLRSVDEIRADENGLRVEEFQFESSS